MLHLSHSNIEVHLKMQRTGSYLFINALQNWFAAFCLFGSMACPLAATEGGCPVLPIEIDKKQILPELSDLDVHAMPMAPQKSRVTLPSPRYVKEGGSFYSPSIRTLAEAPFLLNKTFDLPSFGFIGTKPSITPRNLPLLSFNMYIPCWQWHGILHEESSRSIYLPDPGIFEPNLIDTKIAFIVDAKKEKKIFSIALHYDLIHHIGLLPQVIHFWIDRSSFVSDSLFQAYLKSTIATLSELPKGTLVDVAFLDDKLTHYSEKPVALTMEHFVALCDFVRKAPYSGKKRQLSLLEKKLYFDDQIVHSVLFLSPLTGKELASFENRNSPLKNRYLELSIAASGDIEDSAAYHTFAEHFRGEYIYAKTAAGLPTKIVSAVIKRCHPTLLSVQIGMPRSKEIQLFYHNHIPRNLTLQAPLMIYGVAPLNTSTIDLFIQGIHQDKVFYTYKTVKLTQNSRQEIHIKKNAELKEKLYKSGQF